MPTYQYACPDCGYKFELKQKFADDPVKRCPKCEHRHVYRVVGTVGISFKGSGWYITDSKSSAEKHTIEHKPKEKEAAPGTNGASEGAGKTEPKTETKTETKPAEKVVTEKPAEKAVSDKPAKKD